MKASPASLFEAGNRQARRVFLWALGSFVFLQAGMAVGIERWFPEFRDPLYVFKARRLHQRTVEDPTKPLSVVLLGSSRTVFGFKAGMLEKPLSDAAGRSVVAFNFGVTGAGPVTSLMMLRRLLAEGIRPDVLVQEVLPPLLNGSKRVAEVDRLNPDRLWYRELSLVEHYGRSHRELHEDWWLSCLVPWYEHRFAIMSRAVPAYLPWRLRLDWFQAIDASGWVNSPAGFASEDHRALATERTRQEYAAYLNEFQVGGPPCEALSEELELCRREGIRVVLLLMPEGSAFRSWYGEANWRQVESFLTGLCVKYNVPLIDARCWIADDQFSDSHHLLATGAADFTDRLGREGIMALIASPGIEVSSDPLRGASPGRTR